MKVYYLDNINEFSINISNLSLVLGLFDGIHIGHAQLISFARSNNAKELLNCYGDMLSQDDKRYINIFINYNKNIWTKLKLLMSIRIHSTSIFRECIYWFLIIRGRL